MPQYLYQCQKCKRELKIEHGIKEDALTHQEHPDKGKSCDGKLVRLIAPGGSFVLKGSGWTGKHFT